MDVRWHRGCPVCGGPYEFITFLPGDIPSERRSMAVCTACTHVFVANPPCDREMRQRMQGSAPFEGTYPSLRFEDIPNRGRWEAFLERRLRMLHRFLGGEAGLRAPLRIAEVGCLEGRALAELAAMGHEVVGCDLNAEAVALGRRFLGLDLRLGSVGECLPLWGRCDLVLAIHVIQHCPCPMPELASWVRLLKPGGRLLVDVALNRLDYPSGWCVQYFTESSARTLLGTFFERTAFWLHPRPDPSKTSLDLGTFVGTR